MIDCGFVKLMRYDELTDCKQLSCEIISRANADQRAGRAGRTQNGHCYRLYSRSTYESKTAFTEPEILRTSLTEVCLSTKVWQTTQPISQFLSRLIEPPNERSISAAINLLKYRQMLQEDETLTNLGTIAAYMPVDCKFVKALVMSITLRCQEPVAYIVSMLSTKTPFRTSSNRDERLKINKRKEKFHGDSTSDFFVLFNVYDQYINQYEKRKFCAENFLSAAAMQNAHGVFNLLKRALSSFGFLHTKNRFLYSSANVNCNKGHLIDACLAASLYPNMCYATGDSLKNIDNPNYDERIHRHPLSVVREHQIIDSTWLMFNEKQRSFKSTTIKTIAIIPSMTVCLFGGQRLIFDPNDRTLSVDNMVQFRVNESIMDNLFYLRDAIDESFKNTIENPKTAGMTHEEGRRVGNLLNILMEK